MKLLKHIIFLFVFIPFTIALAGSCQSNAQKEAAKNTLIGATEQRSLMLYDSVKAERYGADQYGMKKYVMAFLKRGPNREFPPEEAASLQRAHLDNIARLTESGKLFLAGPFLDDGDLRGIYIFNVATVEEARGLTATDPAIKAGSLIMEMKEWYGSAALRDVYLNHPTLAKEKI